MKNSVLIMAILLLFSSCAKEEFATNKGKQSSNSTSAQTTTNQLCSQSTLISPQVDILMLWDNTSSFNFVNTDTKNSMSSLISSVSENFDYHILAVPLVPYNNSNLFEAQLVAKNNANLSGAALNILKSKESAIASLGFSQGVGSAETGVDRAASVIEQNRSNGIFRNGAYTIIVLISNEDDKGCSLTSGGYICNNSYDKDAYLAPRIKKLLCMRGNTVEDCSSTGYSSGNALNATMMRFINISPLTSCASGNYLMNYSYRKVAKTLYEASYTNGWPTSNDHISPDVSGAPDSYNLCSISFSHIFDGVNTAIKQTLLKHKYDYWPVTGSSTPLDPDTLRVVRSDGKILANRTGESNPSNGYVYAGTLNGQNTRYSPTAGEPFTGKMIRLIGGDGNDKIVYPDCLTVTFTEPKSNFGYIYLSNGTPNVSTVEVYLNNVKVPASGSNGWSYIGQQYTSALNSNLKVVNLPAGAPSGLFIQLNGSYQVSNSAANNFLVYYTSTGN